MTSNHCFVAGTLIDTPDGKVPIEQIQEGDYVLSTDKKTGDTTYKQVLETYVRDEYTLVHLVVDGEVITTTEEHPFFVSDKGWVIAKELAINDRLVASDGSTKTVELISEEQLERHVKVYNFAVEDYHTYYVGSGVLVHNMCATSTEKTKPLSPNEIGDIGENNLKKMFGGESQVTFETGLGKRRVDQFANGIAHESKVGKVSCTKFVKNQLLKDAELISNPNSGVNKVVWHFFRSPVTGKGGPTKPLIDFMNKCGIQYVIH